MALLDGGFYPDTSLLSPDVAAAFQAELRAQWDRAFVPYGAVVDEGCTARWAATDPWRCADLYEVLRHQLDTPYFLAIDHLNPATVDDFVALGSTTEAFASASAASVQQLIDGVPAMSARATTCEEHAILTEGPPFFVETVTDGSGTAWTLHDAAVAWLAGDSVAANGAPDGSTSDCLGPGVR